MNKFLAIAAVLEVATGMALIVMPSLVAQLLLGTELTSDAVPMARVAGLALLALGIACWPSPAATRTALVGMIVYGLLVAIYLASLGLRGESVGPLLWPAAALHTVLTVLLLRSLNQAGSKSNHC